MVDEDEKKIFRKAMQGVKALPIIDKIGPSVHVQNINNSPEVLNEAQNLTELSDRMFLEDESLMEFSRPGLQHKTLKRLKRGELRPKARLDLHGFTLEMARDEVARFIYHGAEKQLKSVIVIHGKGNHTEGKAAVLKPKVNVWLRQLAPVLAFCPALARDGGGGAVYILLKTFSVRLND